MRLRHLSLSTRLNLSLLAFLLLLAGAASAVIFYGFERAQDDATTRSRQALEEQGKLALQAAVGGVSDSGALQIEWAAAIGQRAARYMDDFSSTGLTPHYDVSRFARTDQGVWYDPDPNRTSDVVVPNHVGAIEGGLLDDIAYSAALDPLYRALTEGFPGELSGAGFRPIAITYIGIRGTGRYYPPIGIEKTTPPEVDISDFYDRFGPAANPDHHTTWTSPYEDLQGRGLVMTARTPIYQGDEFRGIFEVDLSIDGLAKELDAVHPTPGGFAFYVDVDGGILGSNASGALGQPPGQSADVARVIAAMKAPPTDGVPVERVSIHGEDYFLAYRAMPAVGGALGAAAPVREITASALPITAGINDQGARTLELTLAALGGLFVAGLAGATFMNRRLLIQPIQQLVSATRSVAAGNMDTNVSIDRGDELGELGQSFNAMVGQIRESEQQLEGRVATRTRELNALLEADRAMFGSLGIDHVLQALADVAVDVLGTDKSIVTFWDADLQRSSVRAWRNFAEESVRAFDALPPELGAMRHDGQPTEYQHGSSDVAAELREILDREGIMASAGVPLRPQAGKAPWGGFGVAYATPHVFTPEERQLLAALADRASIAIQNAQLHEKAQQAASLEERQRLARELHDSVSQALYGIVLGARAAKLRLDEGAQNVAEPVDYVMSLAQAGLAEMRALIFELRPESLEQEGLVAAIEKHIASVEARYGLAVSASLGEEPECSLELKEALYRIVQEALHNVIKHAQAISVEVSLRREGENYVLTVRDDGRGFDPVGPFPGHVGLRSMPERAAKVGGTVVVESTPGSGTTVTARVPAGA